MDLDSRKNQFIQELFSSDEESSIEALEPVLKREKEEHQEISLDQLTLQLYFVYTHHLH